ncbi:MULTISPECIES: DUF5134 domain-containing protein [Streptomyces]|uniref:DUF5134 domain-containing protein n=1 Tax=Streptomyces luteosporeus TaxID=173856 RepID=A0ABN3TKX7_9ACTN
MHGPPLAGWLLVVLGTATGAYCLLRARTGAAGERRSAADDAVMGLGMAAMAVPATAWDTAPWRPVLLAALFAAAAVRALMTGHHLHHTVGALAMVYMSVAMVPASTQGTHTGHHRPAGTPLLTGLLLLYFAAYVVRTAAAVVPVPAPAGGPPRPPGRELTHACRLSMAIGMLTMLLTL